MKYSWHEMNTTGTSTMADFHTDSTDGDRRVYKYFDYQSQSYRVFIDEHGMMTEVTDSSVRRKDRRPPAPVKFIPYSSEIMSYDAENRTFIMTVEVFERFWGRPVIATTIGLTSPDTGKQLIFQQTGSHVGRDGITTTEWSYLSDDGEFMVTVLV